MLGSDALVPTLLLLGANIAAFGSPNAWSVDRHVDSMTDRLVKKAVVRNPEGHELQIYREQEHGRVYGTFRISDDSSDILDPEELPIYRVDKREPERIVGRAFEESTDIPSARAKPKWVHFLLWHGEGRTAVAGTLRDLMDGDQVVFRYFLFTGGYKETRFSLEGAKEAIAEALDIAPDPTVAERQREEALRLGFSVL